MYGGKRIAMGDTVFIFASQNETWSFTVATFLMLKLALIQGLPRIIEQAVKPMQSIDSIRIMQVDGLNAGAASAHAGDGAPPPSSGNLAEQAVGAALKYRAYAPVVDQLIKEVGLSGDGLGGLVKATPVP